MFWSSRKEMGADSGGGEITDLDNARKRMVESQLRGRGVSSSRVLDVMGTVPRERFLDPGQARYAYRDRALPLAHGQTVSQPYMVAVMTEALDLEPDHRVLEIGTGSGYQTAIIAKLSRDVFSVERIPELSERAHQVLDGLGVENVHLRVGDGSLGWPEEAPFQRIMVTAGAPTTPEALQHQLDPEGGLLVVPVGDRRVQDLLCVTREGERFTTRSILACRFVPLLGKEGWDFG